MELFDLLTNVFPDRQMACQAFLESHPKAYVQECQGLRCGIIRYHEWRVTDPALRYATLGNGRTAEEAVSNAFWNWKHSFGEPI